MPIEFQELSYGGIEYSGKGLIIEKVKRKRFELIFIIYKINLVLNIFNISLKLNLIVFIVKQIPSCSMVQ